LNAGERKSTSRFKWFSRRKQAQKDDEEEEKQDNKPSGFGSWYNKIKQKRIETEKKERALKSTRIKIITLILTFISMGLAFSFIPLFPQPLPLLLAVLVAFVAFQSPRFGMPVGSVIIGIGLIYHLSLLNFIAYIGFVPYRYIFVIVFMAVFVALPIFFYRYRHAIAINLGIISAMVLFFNPTYFLAVPLILTSAVFFKKNAALSAAYYVLISSPLLIIEYFNHIVTITRSPDWWLAPGASPPIFTSLNSVYTGIQSSMPQFRLFEAQKFVDNITAQFTSFPDSSIRNINNAFLQYRDSFPGILMFVVIIVGMVLAIILLAGMFVKATNLAYADRIMSSLTATLATALFFIFLGALQGPLAFTAKVNGTTTFLATLATLAFTLPISLINYTPKKNATSDMITEKANALLGELQTFETHLNNVKDNIPINVSIPEGKMLVIKDKLNDILRKSSDRFFEESELDKIFTDLDKNVSVEISNLTTELNAMLSEYQIYVNTQYASCLGRLKDVGLDLKPSVKLHYETDLPLDQRIECIKEVLEGGRVLTVDVIQVVDPIYVIIRALYDQNLPKDSHAIAFAKQKLDEKAPWVAIEALYSSLNNWRKQYGAEISKSTEYLKKSLMPIINLSAQNDSLSQIIGNKTPSILGDAKKAQAIKEASDKKPLNVLNLITIRDLLDVFLDVFRDVFSVLDEALKDQEKSIEEMLPTSNYLWEKNITLKERMTQAMDVLSNSKYKVNEVMESLPKFEGYIDECIETLTLYNERKEFLLNYPMAKIVIENLLKQKPVITKKDLPFETKYAAEYLRIFYLQNYNEFAYDKQNELLSKKT